MKQSAFITVVLVVAFVILLVMLCSAVPPTKAGDTWNPLMFSDRFHGGLVVADL
jgi:hypothetical protein